MNQQSFMLPKIRSLPTTTSSTLDKYALNAVTYGKWTRLLRKSHLDELQQLWAVVAGHMSLVGPRPEMVALSSTFDAQFVEMRTLVLPGVTGTWQISEAAAELINESPEFDRLYVEFASPRLDWWILRRTLKNFASGEPATLVELKEQAGRAHNGAKSVAQDQSVA